MLLKDAVKPVLSILRQVGIRLIVYLDDILLMAPSVEQVLQHAASTLNLLEGLGFTVNYLKSVLAPFQLPSTIGTSNKRKTLSSDFANLTKL